MSTVQSPFIPRLGWIIFAFKQIGLNEGIALATTWWALVALGCLLVLGLFPRPTAILAWFVQLACAKSGGLLSYGADNLITIGLFYLMIAPLPHSWSPRGRLRNRDKSSPQLLGFHRRVLQIHLCLIYFFGGLTKCLGAWLVEWLQHVALTDDPAVRSSPAPLDRVRRFSPARPGDRNLSARDDLPVPYLAATDAKACALLHLRDAPWDWHSDGHVSFRGNHDRLECRGILAGRNGGRDKTSAVATGSGPECDLTGRRKRLPPNESGALWRKEARCRHARGRRGES